MRILFGCLFHFVFKSMICNNIVQQYFFAWFEIICYLFKIKIEFDAKRKSLSTSYYRKLIIAMVYLQKTANSYLI